MKLIGASSTEGLALYRLIAAALDLPPAEQVTELVVMFRAQEDISVRITLGHCFDGAVEPKPPEDTKCPTSSN